MRDPGLQLAWPGTVLEEYGYPGTLTVHIGITSLKVFDYRWTIATHAELREGQPRPLFSDLKRYICPAPSTSACPQKGNKTPKHKVNYSSKGLERNGLIFLLMTNESIIEKEGRRILKRW
jgi:hypothetical protein